MVYKKKYRKKRGSSMAKAKYKTKDFAYPLGRKFVTKLRYYTGGFDINPGVVGTPDSTVFSTNGMYDTDISGVGHQPTGFDQIMAMYDHYTVIGCKATLEAWNSDADYPQTVAIFLKDDSVKLLDIRPLVENGNCEYRLLSPSGSGSKNYAKLSMNINPNRFLGRSNPLSEDDLRGSAGSNPVEQAYLHVFVEPLGSVDTSAVNCVLTLEFTAVFTEPKTLAIS